MYEPVFYEVYMNFYMMYLADIGLFTSKSTFFRHYFV